VKIDDLAGRRVLVTGASTGIGAAVARAFGAQGARLALHYNASRAAAEALAREIRQNGALDLVLVGGDFSDRSVPPRVVAEAAEHLGGLDVLINNAGALVRRSAFADFSDELIDAVFELNARSLVTATQAAVPYLAERRGCIINVGSSAANDGGAPGSAIYAASKAFVHNLTRHLARDLATKGIRVNAVAPGVTDTPFHASTPADRMAALAKAIPLGRVGRPQDCTGAFLFLASEELSSFVTGQILHVNGGLLMP
jgi:3-oxoacyl-[acyl-carrier protein] reductase